MSDVLPVEPDHDARDQQLSAIPPEIADPLHTSWRHALLVGLAAHRRVPGRRQSKTRNLLERLRDRDAQVLLFARDLSVSSFLAGRGVPVVTPSAELPAGPHAANGFVLSFSTYVPHEHGARLPREDVLSFEEIARVAGNCTCDFMDYWTPLIE